MNHSILGGSGEFDLLYATVFWLLLAQLSALAILLSRLLPGAVRAPSLEPCQSEPSHLGQVSILVPTLNEAARITPCLKGLSRQGYEVREILIIDSASQDGTPDLVKQMGQRDPRFRLLQDDPLPPNWIGRPWALHTGFLASSEQSTWVLGIDADTEPDPGLVASLLQVATTKGYDLISLSPRFILKSAGEIWLQPALLMTLVYRFGPPGERGSTPERVMANGQCFFCRRSVLAQVGGYSSAGQSFCDDVTLARQIAHSGYNVGFLDGSSVLKVRMYEGMAETWREWGRSLDLKDATTPAQTWGDCLFLLLVQGLPLPMLLLLSGMILGGHPPLTIQLAWGLNLLLMLIRIGLTGAIAGAYDFSKARFSWFLWLSPLADPLAVVRIGLSSLRVPTAWRGRTYPS